MSDVHVLVMGGSNEEILTCFPELTHLRFLYGEKVVARVLYQEGTIVITSQNGSYPLAPQEIDRSVGGGGVVAALSARRWAGGGVTLITPVGRNEGGLAIRQFLMENDINLVELDRQEAGVGVVAYDQEGNHLIFGYRPPFTVPQGILSRLSPRYDLIIAAGVDEAYLPLLEAVVGTYDAPFYFGPKPGVLQSLLRGISPAPLLFGRSMGIQMNVPEVTTTMCCEEAEALLWAIPHRFPLAMTNGKAGGWLVLGNEVLKYDALPAPGRGLSTGCGDAFLAAWGISRLFGVSLEEALRFARAAGALVASRHRSTVIPTFAELEEYLGKAGPSNPVVVSKDQLIEQLYSEMPLGLTD